jgi:ParB-like chromosome segregation protein Spo0J
MKVKTNQIKNNPKNPRIKRDDKFLQLKKSIQEFPEMLEKRPIVCFTDKDGKYVALGGNMRLKATKELGIEEVEITLADEWTEEQKNQFIIKDNVGYGDWDWDILANEWNSELLNDWGLDVISSSDEDIDFDNINSTEEREKQFETHLVTCPSCETKFNIQK